jgi:general secretion pathway protein B
VTGVAWQDERGSRRAVVNGLLLGEGAEVSGARIVEIRPDRVRFSRGGQDIAVPVSTPFGK